MKIERSSDERLMAAIAHGSVVLTGPGIAVAVLIWLTQKEKSAYAAAQAMQAAVYQLLGTIAVMGLWVAYSVFVTVALIPVFQDPAQYENTLPPLFGPSMASMIIPFVVMVIWWLYGLWGAFQCWRGETFRYVLIGKRILTE
ncbi:MAG: DUF4870 domain-containing protein [Anaerolineae bacterium]|nr:DUF4870 domain-containing protein [Anaerolineae bacterium]